MSDGENVPAHWSGKDGEIEVKRDTRVFKDGPASLLASVSGNRKGAAFQNIAAGPNRRVKVSGWIRSEGDVRAQAMAHAFSQDYQQNQFFQLQFLKGDNNWKRFEKEVQLPEWAAHVRIGVLAEGDGKAWIDDMRAEQ